MKVKKLKIGIQTIMMSGLFIFLIACNNSDTTKSPANTPAGNDTAMNNNPSTDTSATKSTTKTPTKKTRKVRIGSMASKETAEVKADNTGVYNVADVMPQYPGGQNALEDYMNNNVEYPQAAVDNNSEGTVDVQFIIDENGKVTDAKTTGTQLGNGLDEEAVKLVSNMPKWTPGKVKGKNVKTRMVLPVTYRLEE